MSVKWKLKILKGEDSYKNIFFKTDYLIQNCPFENPRMIWF